ncbi:hypothetical protein SARC_03715 [Sphaeroforma arctica JP610]|uniref:Uncharacterized protein n=1 Tax=Sphaeroforma arctica JP610 TaxID=667725 RepID=A0A0L0G756_9EUKA|nr:hypothetical protein SARC_03715 [Sphaeroforma arctica JP610]KNC84053.1 hypothetical protein SARC_03715 [Sphaeroforma arctica JP610]|eukprot:XP_014157955.1 hypothetical protein SARC_03715 [Sphaeroforma arctica JP610]
MKNELCMRPRPISSGRASPVATLVENKHRAAHGITGACAEVFEAVLQKKQDFTLNKGTSNTNRQLDTKRDSSSDKPASRQSNTTNGDRSRGRGSGGRGGGRNDTNKGISSPFKPNKNPFKKKNVYFCN